MEKYKNGLITENKEENLKFASKEPLFILDTYLELYLDFFKKEYNSTKEFLEKRRKEIIAYPEREYGLIYSLTKDEQKEISIEINFSLRRLAYFVDTDLVDDEVYTEKEFLELLKNISFNCLISKFSKYEDE